MKEREMDDGCCAEPLARSLAVSQNNSDELASDLRTCRMFFQTTWMGLTCEFVSGKEVFAKHGT